MFEIEMAEIEIEVEKVVEVEEVIEEVIEIESDQFEELTEESALAQKGVEKTEEAERRKEAEQDETVSLRWQHGSPSTGRPSEGEAAHALETRRRLVSRSGERVADGGGSGTHEWRTKRDH